MSKHFSYKLYIISFVLIYSDTAIDDNFLQLLWKMLKGQRNELLSPEKNLTLILVISISVLSLQV